MHIRHVRRQGPSAMVEKICCPAVLPNRLQNSTASDRRRVHDKHPMESLHHSSERRLPLLQLHLLPWHGTSASRGLVYGTVHPHDA